MAKKILVFQHTAWEGPGHFLLGASKAHRLDLKVVELWHEPVPDPAGCDALIVLGGSPNVDQEDLFPYLKREKEVIRRSVEEDRPYLGFCLGHQLLAHCLGATVGPNPTPVVGFQQGYLTEDGRAHPLFRNIPKSFPLFKWHTQAVQLPLPRSLQVLATSQDCQVEALSIVGRPGIVGVQFDNHVAHPQDVSRFLFEDNHWLVKAGLQGAASTIREEAERCRQTCAVQFRTIFSNFVGML